VTVNAHPDRPRILTLSLLYDVTGSAEIMKLLLYQMADFRMHLVTIKTQTISSLIDKIVVAIKTRLFRVVFVGKGQGQQRVLFNCPFAHGFVPH
jgi:hypothetical protein